MRDCDKTQAELIAELTALRAEVALLKQAKAASIAESNTAIPLSLENPGFQSAAQHPAEHTLEQEINFRKALLNASVDGIVVLDQQGNVIEANKSFARMLGYSLTEVVNLNLIQFDAQEHSAVIEQKNATSSFCINTFETRHRRKNGSIYDVEISANSIDWDGRKVQLCICRDISNRKQAEHQLQEQQAILRESNRRWNSLLDNVQLTVVRLNTQGIIEYANPCFLRLTGYSDETQLLGCSWFGTFLPQSDQNAMRVIFHRIMQGSQGYSHVQNRILTRKGEERTIAWNNTLLRDVQGNAIGVISVGEDITDRQKLERMKAEFVAIISHEIRTPLTALQAGLGLLADQSVDAASEDGQNIIQVAVGGVDRLVRLINDVLDIERFEAGKVYLEKDWHAVDQLVIAATDQLQGMLKQAGIRLNMNVQSHRIYVDGDRISQVLINLLSNAVKFSPNGSLISIFVKQEPNYSLFSIQDQGRGIPSHKIDNIFERFHQVNISDSREKGGTGLGLAICRNIIQQHGGQIWVDSALDQGSTFYFTLPLTGTAHYS